MNYNSAQNTYQSVSKSAKKTLASILTAVTLYGGAAYAKPKFGNVTAQPYINVTEQGKETGIELNVELLKQGKKSPIELYAYDPIAKKTTKSSKFGLDIKGGKNYKLILPSSYAGKQIVLYGADGIKKTDRTSIKYTVPALNIIYPPKITGEITCPEGEDCVARLNVASINPNARYFGSIKGPNGSLLLAQSPLKSSTNTDGADYKIAAMLGRSFFMSGTTQVESVPFVVLDKEFEKGTDPFTKNGIKGELKVVNTIKAKKKADIKKLAKAIPSSTAGFFSNAEGYSDKLNTAGFDYVISDSDSQIEDGTDVRKLTADGSATSLNFDQIHGLRSPKNSAALRVSGNYNNTTIPNLIVERISGSIGDIKGTGLELAVQGLYGRNIGSTNWKDSVETALGVWFKSSNNDMKYDILKIKTDESLMGGIVTVRLNGSIQKIPFRLTGEGIIASGKYNSDVSIPSLGMILPKNSSDVGCTRMGLNFEIFPSKISSLETRIGYESEERKNLDEGSAAVTAGLTGKLIVGSVALKFGYDRTLTANETIGKKNYPLNNSNVTIGLQTYTTPITKFLTGLFARKSSAKVKSVEEVKKETNTERSTSSGEEESVE